MPFEEFVASITQAAAPASTLSPALRAMWYDARNDWNVAHEAAQNDRSADGSWVHAYLHRKEGDVGNAGCWYAKAGRSRPADDVTLAGEWEQIVRTLLKDPEKA